MLTARLVAAAVLVFHHSGVLGAPPTACGTRGVALQVLGSGGPELKDERASSSYLIWVDARPVALVDAGGGAALRFGQSGASVTPLDVILLTHLHVDHTSDLPALVKSSYFENRTRPLPIFGPVGNEYFPSTSQFVKSLFGASTGLYRYLGAYLTANSPDAYSIQAHDVVLKGDEIRRIYETADIQVFAATALHGTVPALAYRITVAGRNIAFSGDNNGNNGNLQRLAMAADVLVAHNAVLDGATGVERALHMPPAVIGRIAQQAGVRKLVLSHRMLRTLGHEAETLSSIRKSYAGPAVFADDLTCIVLD
jgi:ribonuclease BN (tRNA processing enzyme)